MMSWAPPDIIAMQAEIASVTETLQSDSRDVEILQADDPHAEDMDDTHMFDLTAEEMLPPAAPDTIMAPPAAPPPLPPPVTPAPVTPPKKTKEPPMSQAKRAKGDKGTPIKTKTMADGLDMAYNTDNSRATIGTVVFLAGTKTWGDVGDDILILEGRVRETEKYREIRQWIMNLPWKPSQFVGHSLGAAVARALSEDTGIPCTTFNDPTPSWNRDQPGNFSSAMDPISMFNWGQTSTPSDSWNPHSYHGKASRRSFNLDPHEKDDMP